MPRSDSCLNRSYMYIVLYYLTLTFAYLYISFFKSNKKTLGGPLPCTLKSKQRFEKISLMLTFIPLLSQTEQWLHQRHLAAALSNAMPHDKMNSRNSTYCNFTVDKVLELIQNSIHIGILFCIDLSLKYFCKTRSCLFETLIYALQK